MPPAAFREATGESPASPARDQLYRSSFVLGVRSGLRRGVLDQRVQRFDVECLAAAIDPARDLHVDSDSLTGATRLYERVGMTAHPRFATWEKDLRPGSARGS